MAAVTAGEGRRSLLGMALGAIQSRAAAKGRQARLAAFVQENVLTVAAMAAIDVGMFHLGVTQGLLAVGGSLLVIDFKVQG